MQTSRNPAKSRPLSANVKRLMRLARASPQNSQVIKVARQFTGRDLAYCHNHAPPVQRGQFVTLTGYVRYFLIQFHNVCTPQHLSAADRRQSFLYEL